MFDLSWSEIALLVIVALVLIGPKDLPVALRAISRGIKALRRLAGEFQQHLDEMVREADISEARDTLGQLRRFNMREQITRAIDPDRAMRDSLTHDVQVPSGLPQVPAPPPSQTGSVGEAAPYNAQAVRQDEARARALEATPAIIPPLTALRVLDEAPHLDRPAFLPPEVALHHGRRVVIIREGGAGENADG